MKYKSLYTMAKPIAVITAVAAVLLFILATIVGPSGADVKRYLQWAKVFVTHDFNHVRSETLSVTGLPLTQWSHGPGLILSMPYLLLGNAAVRAIGLFFSVFTISFIVLLILRLLKGDALATILFISLSLLGTQFGFYVFVHSSESMSFMPIAGIVYWLLTRQKYSVSDTMVLGLFSYIIVIVRLQLILYCIPAFVLVMIDELMSHEKKTKLVRLILKMIVFIVPIFAALLQIGIVNRIMTGSILHSPYTFGDEEFRSLDLRHLQIAAILFHPWHGLISYHPIYLICLPVIVYILNRVRSFRVKIFLILFAAVAVTHIVIQGAWYVWWLGQGTYGMRGLSAFFVLLTPLLALYYRYADKPEHVIIMSLVCSIWSFLLLYATTISYFQYYTFNSLLLSQLRMLKVLYEDWIPLYLLIAMLLAFWLSKNVNARERLVFVSTTILCLLYVFYLSKLVFNRVYFLESLSFFHRIINFVTSILIPVTLRRLQSNTIVRIGKRLKSERFRVVLRRFDTSVMLIVLPIFIITVAIFAIFFSQLPKITENAQKVKREYSYRAAFQVEEAITSYYEYLEVPGFQKDKKRLEAFIQRSVTDY